MFININCNVYTHAYIVNKLNSVDYQFEEKKNSLWYPTAKAYLRKC